ncbi:unnamed protein product [Darwinula stevensoni]|uniref:Uncharacterized protein n=1 Tax=Darwinula stevensoni TaxID=69355 RepID=A0A7R8X8Z8_9CRUS|nr:unnamed protein product [Darwinula stevensoni]CAG0890172.1 unnamed protein product [Darwinula stevensoni]
MHGSSCLSLHSSPGGVKFTPVLGAEVEGRVPRVVQGVHGCPADQKQMRRLGISLPAGVVEGSEAEGDRRGHLGS